MASMTGPRPRSSRRRAWGGVLVALMLAASAAGFDVGSAHAQLLNFPARPKPPAPGPSPLEPTQPGGEKQMLVRASEVNYDYTNERVSAVGNVQIYYGSATVEADRVVYDQKTKRLHAEGNVRLTEPDGTVTYGEIIDLGDDLRDGFVDSLRVDAPDDTRFASSRAQRSAGNFTVFESGVYTACEPCKDDPKKPPKWQVKAARIIHDQGEKMMYFEDARIEFFGIPLAYFPYLSAPDPTVKRKTGVLLPTFSTSTAYGVGVAIPYYWAIAPDYDATFTPTITTKQGPLLQAEWRQRLINGSYTIRGSGIFQLDKNAFLAAGDIPGYRDWRGSVETAGQFNLSEKWSWGWEGTVVSDKTFLQDYSLYKNVNTITTFIATPDYALSQGYLTGRGDRSYFDARALYFYAFSAADDQKQIPVVHPVVDYDYTLGKPVMGGELSFRSNLTSLSRESANFDPISAFAMNTGVCALATADPAIKNINNCLLRGVPGTYTRASGEANWRRTFTDPFGQVFTPFASVRADIADAHITPDPGVGNYITTGSTDVVRLMPTVGLDYRYPFISVQSWGTQTVEPIAQIIFRPDETKIGALPNEDAQSLIFDDSNLFKINKFSGWDRVEGGSRANVGVQYTAQFNRAGSVNLLFGQSYQLFGQNSFAVGGITNTGLNSGLDTARSDYVARASYQPTSALAFTSRFRFSEQDFTLQRSELEATANFGRWTTTVLYGHYAAQPAIGFPSSREGILGTARVKLNPNWVVMGGAQVDLKAGKVSQTQIGVGYVDDCFILALNYVTSYSYSGSTAANSAIMMQVSLRTLGGSTSGQPTGPGSFGGAGH